MNYPVDMTKPWYHGSPFAIDMLREGSTITQWKELAEAFATKPAMLGYDEIHGNIFHSGTEKGILYAVDEPLTMDVDLYQHPRTTMDQGVEFLTKRPLTLKRLSPLSPKEVLSQFVALFNAANAEGLSELYADNAVNHQVANEPVVGKAAIYQMFVAEFAAAEMVCIVENMFEDGEWAIMEWKDPKGLRGCGFFHVVDGKIVMQRGYWDKLSFMNG